MGPLHRQILGLC